MFEHYMSYQYADPRRQRMMGIAATISGVLTLSIVTFAWAANKMDVSRVEPPASNYVVFQLTNEDPPPPPPPPPAGSLDKDEGETSNRPAPEDTIPDEAPEEEPLAAPDRAPDRIPKPRGGRSGGGVPGVPGSGAFGVPGGPIGVGIGTPLSQPRTPRTETKQPAPTPISAVMAQAVFTPDPDRAKLASTRAGMFDKRPCTNKTSFCVDPRGQVVDVRTRKGCYDNKVDAICRETVAKWRFKPFVVGGRPQKTCSVVRFDLEFRD